MVVTLIMLLVGCGPRDCSRDIEDMHRDWRDEMAPSQCVAVYPCESDASRWIQPESESSNDWYVDATGTLLAVSLSSDTATRNPCDSGRTYGDPPACEATYSLTRECVIPRPAGDVECESLGSVPRFAQAVTLEDAWTELAQTCFAMATCVDGDRALTALAAVHDPVAYPYGDMLRGSVDVFDTDSGQLLSSAAVYNAYGGGCPDARAGWSDVAYSGCLDAEYTVSEACDGVLGVSDTVRRLADTL